MPIYLYYIIYHYVSYKGHQTTCKFSMISIVIILLMLIHILLKEIKIKVV